MNSKVTKKKSKSTNLGIYFDKESREQLKTRVNELSGKFKISRSKVARVSLNLGLSQVEKDPLLLLTAG
jgi:hypothetical protein